MYLKRGQYSTTEKLYLFIWTFYSLASFLLGSELSIEYDLEGSMTFVVYITFGCQLLLLFSFFWEKYTLKQITKYLFFLMLVLLVGLPNTRGGFFVVMLFIVLAQNIDIDKLISYDIKLKIIILSCLLLMVATGIIDNYTSLFYGTTYKHALGFAHPNTFTVYSFTILIEWLCIRYGKMKWYEWVSIGLLTVAIFEIGGGRSSTYTFATVFILYFLATKLPRLFYAKISKIIFFIITPLMAALSFLAAKLYDQGNAIAVALNSSMSNRVLLAARFLKAYEIKPFGQEIEYVSSRKSQLLKIPSAILDNAYVKLALDWGSIMFVVLIVAISFLFMQFLKKRRIDLALFLLFFVILGLGEGHMLSVLYNLPLLCILGYRKNEGYETMDISAGYHSKINGSYTLLRKGDYRKLDEW